MNKTNALCRRLLTVLALVVAMVLPAQVWAGITPVKPSAGDGSSGNPYQIGNAAELYWFAALVNGTLTDGTAQNSNACAILTSNITVNTGVLKADGSLANKVSGFTSWTPISTDYDRRFGGTFDGKGHTVSGLYFNDASVMYVGLFGISDRGTIKNVGVIASYFNGQRNVGGVCGHCYRYSKVTNCFSTSTVYGTTSVGGVCGDIYDNCTLSNSYNTGIVYGNNKVGGVCGGAQHSTISDCYNTGSVTGTASTGYVGGVCGLIGGSTSTMSNCYSTGNVISTSKYSGEINGYVDESKVTNCYYLAASSNGSSGKTAAQFASGEVTWLLNGKQSTGAWGQLLGTDNLPVLNNTNKVYYGYPSCDESKGLGYYNTETQASRPAHSFSTHGICSVCSRNQPAKYVASSSLYQIGNAGQLAWFGQLVNGTLPDGTAQNTAAKGVLTADIDLAPFAHWTPIGNESSKFGGTFDGRGFKVQHMSITRQGSNSGLFGYASGATLQHISIDGNVTLRTTSYTEGYGSIVGRMDNSTVSHCHSSVNFSIDTEMDASANCIGHIGGIVGKMHESASAVKGCSYSGTINLGNKAVNVAAGIAGYAINSEVPITDCRFTGTIHSGYEGKLIMGGIFGYTRTSGKLKVTNCLQAGVLEKAGNQSLSGILIGQINNGYGANAVQNNYYAHDGLHVIGSTTGTPATTPATLCTTEQLASGEVTWLLNGKQPTGTWGQLLGTDNLPMLDNTNKVYYGYQSCDESKGLGYYNTETQETRPAHSFNTNGFCNVCSGYQPATYVESSSQYEIANAGQLYWFAALVNGSLPDGTAQNLSANAVLKNDITVNTGVLKADGTLADDVSGFRSWTPMGTYSTKRYEGTFDGMGHTVSGLYYNNGNVHYVGLFGTSFNATIKNVGVVDSYLKGNTYVGGICGFCYVYNKGSVTNCFNSSTISGKEYVGGVCGYSLGNTFTHNYNTGQVSGTYREIGGLCGSIMGGSCENSYNTGSVTGINNRDQLGGVCGYMGNTRIENCYNTGAVSGAGSGPIYGELYNSTVTNSYYLASSDDDAGGKTAAQFAGGEVAWLLNGSQPTGTWGQLLGTDNLPVLDNTNKVLACALDATNATYWLTYSNLTADAALSVPADRELLVCNAQVKKGVLTLSERDDNLVAKGEGVLVKTDAPYLNAMPHTGSVLTPAAENDLVATPAEAQTIVADAGYTLYRLTYSNATTKEGLGFYLGVSGSSKDGSQLKATPGKAYLNVLTSEATAPASASPALAFRFADNDGETTSLRGISTTDGTMGAPAATYDLTGRKVSRPAHGLYIQNGKKVILK